MHFLVVIMPTDTNNDFTGGKIMKRKRMSRPKSRSDFRRKAGVHPKNNPHRVIMRGGIRL